MYGFSTELMSSACTNDPPALQHTFVSFWAQKLHSIFSAFDHSINNKCVYNVYVKVYVGMNACVYISEFKLPAAL